MDARVDSSNQRLAIYASLRTRNRIISVLRIGLPVLGAIVFIAFVLQIVVASYGSNFGIGKVTFDGSTVKVDTPSYSGVMADGDVYKVSAQAAETALTSLNVIDLKDAAFDLTKPDGTKMSAHATAGAFETLGQTVNVPGAADVADSHGNSGTLKNVVVDIPHQTVKASGKVKLALSNGATIEADSLNYNAKASLWQFGRATLTVPDTDSEEASNP